MAGVPMPYLLVVFWCFYQDVQDDAPWLCQRAQIQMADRKKCVFTANLLNARSKFPAELLTRPDGQKLYRFQAGCEKIQPET